MSPAIEAINDILCVQINGFSVPLPLGEDRTRIEVPFSELAMYCRIAGRVDVAVVTFTERYAFVKFANGDTNHGLIGEILPRWIYQKVQEGKLTPMANERFAQFMCWGF